MARIETENNDTFDVAEAGGHGIQLAITSSEFGIDTNTAHLLTPSEARRIATALITMANKVDAGQSVAEDPIRPEVVTLLAELDTNGTPAQWAHLDGRPLTAEELDTALSATAAELEAAAARMRGNDH